MKTFNQELIKKHIAEIKDFPIAGIDFKDIFPVFQDHLATEALLHEMTVQCKHFHPDYIFGLDSRGFLFGPTIAQRLGIPFLPIRKKGKLPGDCVSAFYTKEYGTDCLETYKMNLEGKRVVLVDDLLATGGTIHCGQQLIQQIHGTVVGSVFAIELLDLNGRQKLIGPVSSVVQY